MSVDQNATLKNADTLLAEGKLGEAVEEYVRLADHLHREGFLAKASAIYKKVLKVQADHEHSLLRLFDIAVAQGMMPDAKPYMRELVKQRQQRSDLMGLAECLARLARLPDDSELRRTRELLGMPASEPAPPPPPRVRKPEPAVEEMRVEATAADQPLDGPQGPAEAGHDTSLQGPAEAEHDTSQPAASETNDSARSLETVFGDMRARTAHDRRALLYDLADALERRGEHERALEIFTDVQSDDDPYRDVAERIERLRAMQQGSVQEGSSGA